jgi:sulfite exporter TauE/SafE
MQVFILTAFLAGLAGSIHCVGMCGPLALSLPFSRFSKYQKWLAIVLYNLGRVGAYSTIGLIVGLLGRGINWFGLTQIISIVLGAIILVSVVLPRLLKTKSIHMPAWINRYQINALQYLIKKQTVGWMFLVGIMNGFLPCGLVYMAVAAALVAGSVGNAVLFMIFFGVGTIPAMVALVAIAQNLPLHIRVSFQKFVPIVSMIIGALLILRGLNLDIPFISPYLSQNLTGANTVECHTP